MTQKTLRGARIIASRVKGMSPLQIVSFLFGSLFVCQRILVYGKELDSGAGDEAVERSGGRIAKGDIRDLARWREQKIVAWEFCCDLFDNVHDFFVFRDNGTVGHISWIYYRGDPNRLTNLQADEAEIKYCLTVEQYRGKSLYPAALNVIQEYLRQNGYRKVFICVKNDNWPSIRGIEKAGFRFVARTSLLKVMGVQISRRFGTGTWTSQQDM